MLGFRFLKGQDIGVDQLMDFNFQGETVLHVMTLYPWWTAQKRSGLQRADNFLGIGGGGLVWTRFSLSMVDNNSAYLIGTGSNCNAFWAWFWGICCWRTCCRYCCWYCLDTGWSICIPGSGSSKDKRSTSINFWTTFFRAKQCSISWPCAP